MALPAPYFQDESCTIYHGDCRELLPLIEPVDLVLTDPPYGETSLDWDRPVDDWEFGVRPLLKPHGSLWCFGSLSYFLDEFNRSDWVRAQEIVWEKHNGSIFHADRFRRVHELAVQFYPVTTRWADVYKDPQFTQDATARTVRRKGRPTHSGNIGDGNYESVDGGPRLMRSVLQVPSCHGYAVHPTQKPEGIVRPLLRYSCAPGGVVLDPFTGSGTTLAVAKQEGRRAIGIEINEEFCAIAAKRLAQAVLPGMGVA